MPSQAQQQAQHVGQEKPSPTTPSKGGTKKITLLWGTVREQVLPHLRERFARFKPVFSPAFQNGLGLALTLGGVVWLIFTGHPLALSLFQLGVALWLSSRERRRS